MTLTSRRPLRASLVAALLATGACSLLTPLDGFSDGAQTSGEGGSGGLDGSIGDGNGGDGPPSNDGATDGREGGASDPSEYEKAVLADGPLAYFRMNETSGPTAKSAVGSATAMYQGAFTFGTAGAVGGNDTSVTFDGVSARLALGDVFRFGGTASYTVECWVRLSVVDDTRFIYTRRAANQRDGYALYYGTGYLISSRTADGSELAYASRASAPLVNTWTHLVATYDGVANLLYENGVLIGSGAVADAPIPDAAGSFVVGDDSPGQFKKFQGQLDELAIYGTALPAARVVTHYKAAKP